MSTIDVTLGIGIGAAIASIGIGGICITALTKKNAILADLSLKYKSKCRALESAEATIRDGGGSRRLAA